MEKQPEIAGKLKIRLVGKSDISVQQDMQAFGLKEHVELVPYLPHDRIIPLLQSASVLYPPINNAPNARSIQTGKLFEYLAAGPPILGVGPVDGDAAAILDDCKAGVMKDFGDSKGIFEQLLQWYREAGQYKDPRQLETVQNYSRKKLAGRFATLLDQLTSKD